MDSRFKPVVKGSSDGESKKKYCDKKFKKFLLKALKTNHGEPDNIDMMRKNRKIEDYPAERIIEYVNTVSADIQKKIEPTIDDPSAKEIFTLTNFMNEMCDGEKPQELPLVLKLQTHSLSVPNFLKTNGVQFAKLHKFLYTATSGLPDFTDLEPQSLELLHDTHRMLVEQVENDATPEFIAELKLKIQGGYTEISHPGIAELAEIFQDKNLNPLNFPFEYLLNGTLPSSKDQSNQSAIEVIPSSASIKISPKKKPIMKTQVKNTDIA